MMEEVIIDIEFLTNLDCDKHYINYFLSLLLSKKETKKIIKFDKTSCGDMVDLSVSLLKKEAIKITELIQQAADDDMISCVEFFSRFIYQKIQSPNVNNHFNIYNLDYLKKVVDIYKNKKLHLEKLVFDNKIQVALCGDEYMQSLIYYLQENNFRITHSIWFFLQFGDYNDKTKLEYVKSLVNYTMKQKGDLNTFFCFSQNILLHVDKEYFKSLVEYQKNNKFTLFYKDRSFEGDGVRRISGLAKLYEIRRENKEYLPFFEEVMEELHIGIYF